MALLIDNVFTLYLENSSFGLLVTSSLGHLFVYVIICVVFPKKSEFVVFGRFMTPVDVVFITNTVLYFMLLWNFKLLVIYI